jgi:hypothetical protein
MAGQLDSKTEAVLCPPRPPRPLTPNRVQPVAAGLHRRSEDAALPNPLEP